MNAIDTNFPHLNSLIVFSVFNSGRRVLQTRYITFLIATEGDIIKEGCHWNPRKTGCFIRYYITPLFPHAWEHISTHFGKNCIYHQPWRHRRSHLQTQKDLLFIWNNRYSLKYLFWYAILKTLWLSIILTINKYRFMFWLDGRNANDSKSPHVHEIYVFPIVNSSRKISQPWHISSIYNRGK